MRNISFSKTKEQFRAHRKHVTRRGNADGPTWKNTKPGQILMGVEKSQGLKKGEHVVPMESIVVLEVNQEPLNHILQEYYRAIPGSVCDAYVDISGSVSEMALEGFPELTPQQFVDMFCVLNDCEPETGITRILFDYEPKEKPTTTSNSDVHEFTKVNSDPPKIDVKPENHDVPSAPIDKKLKEKYGGQLEQPAPVTTGQVSSRSMRSFFQWHFARLGSARH